MIPARPARGILLASGVLVLAGLAVAALSLGQPVVPPGQWWSPPDRLAEIVLQQVRLPRLVLGVVAGACFATAGLLLQETLRNPLATPELLGVGPGAALTVAVLVVWAVPVPAAALPLWAFGGAVVGGLVTVAVARAARTPTAVLLSGAAVGAAFGALVVSVMAMAEQLQVQALFRYLSGSLDGVTWDVAVPAVVWAAVLLPLSVLAVPWLSVLRTGQDTAAAVGLRVDRVRVLMLLLAAALVACCVGATGPIAWIGFLGPHLARLLFPRAGVRWWLPAAMVLGAAVTVAADLAGRLWFAPVETPVGAWTAVLGVLVAVIGLAGRRRHRVAGSAARTTLEVGT